MSRVAPPRVLGYVAAWLVAAALAVAVGLVAVTGVGASVLDRGPVARDEQNVRDLDTTEGSAAPDPGVARVEQTIDDEFGSFVVACQGPYARGLDVRPATGWRTVSYEQGPDDDVDAVFAAGDRSIEIEVFCNDGRPQVSDREVKTLPDDD